MLKRRTFIQQIGLGTLGVGAAIYLPGCKTAAGSGTGTTIYTPESQGVDSQGLLDFFKAVEASDLEFHSIMINRHGKTILEGWWEPFEKPYVHTLYSLSKSFTSTAIGMLHDEGKLTVEDKVISFFPDQLPDTISDNLAAMRVHDLLTMHTGHVNDTMGPLREGGDDWVKTFLALEVAKEPGTHFLYNTGATYMLSAIVQKVSGKPTIEYLRPKLFVPLGIEGADWQEDPNGINVGGYGLRVRTQDILNFGQLYLQEGKWKGKQLISTKWVQEATKKQVNSQENDSDWGQGYGYQFWRCKPGCYRGDGAFGQYCIVVPEKDAVIAITSESRDMGASMQLVWDHILPAMKTDGLTLSPSPNAEQVKKVAASLTIPIPDESAEKNVQQQVHGKSYEYSDNPYNASKVSFTFDGDECNVMFIEKGQGISVNSGLNRWVTADNHKDGETLFAIPGRTPKPTKVSSHYHWSDERTLVMLLKYVENLHHDIFTFTFSDDGLEMTFNRSLYFNFEGLDNRRKPIKAKLA